MARVLTVLFPSLAADHLDRIRRAAEHIGFRLERIESEDVDPAAVSDTEIFFGVSGRLPSVMPGLRWVASPNAGVEPYCNPGVLAPSVLLTNSAGAYGVTISEHIIMVALELLRQRQRYLNIVAHRGWQRDLPVQSLHGSRILMLGTGDIGRETARRLRAFSPRSIIGLNRSGRKQEGIFDDVMPMECLASCLPDADLVIASLPGTPLTAGLLNAERLSLLPAHACIVNVGRGSLIDEAALRQMLLDHRLGGAALDVFCEEPLPKDSPLWDTEGLIITPHISGNTTLPYTVDTIVSLFLENLQRYSDGLPLQRLVDRSLGY